MLKHKRNARVVSAGSIQMVRSSLWEKATREFDPHLPEFSWITNEVSYNEE
jgi:hypothetical protein